MSNSHRLLMPMNVRGLTRSRRKSCTSTLTSEAHRDTLSYLSAASFPSDISPGPPEKPISNTDIALNALVQHGVHKMECDRAFLSFIDNRSQFICAEMTRHQSISGPDPAQPLLLGTSQIPLDWGVCPYTMSIFHGREVSLPESPYIVADESYFCIKDFRQIPTFAARPFVAGYPYMVSYIEVPLRAPSGHILGSYCVVDDKPRDFLDADALRTIGEVTSAISQYLDLKRTELGRLRSERMMDGLRQFVESDQHIASGSDNATTPFTLDVFKPVLQSSASPDSEGNDDCDAVPEQVSAAPPAPSVNSCLAPLDLTVASEDLSMSSADFGPRSGDVPAIKALRNRNVANEATPSLSTQIGDLFSKAARVIGHAMNLDGLVFFDAVGSGPRY